MVRLLAPFVIRLVDRTETDSVVTGGVSRISGPGSPVRKGGEDVRMSLNR